MLQDVFLRLGNSCLLIIWLDPALEFRATGNSSLNSKCQTLLPVVSGVICGQKGFRPFALETTNPIVSPKHFICNQTSAKLINCLFEENDRYSSEKIFGMQRVWWPACGALAGFNHLKREGSWEFNGEIEFGWKVLSWVMFLNPNFTIPRFQTLHHSNLKIQSK